MAELDVETKEVNASPKVLMLTLSGGVDAKSYPTLENALKSAHKAGCTRLVLNLASLRFMNESDKLLKYDAAFKRVGGGIVLYEVPAKLRVMFSTLDLDKKLPFHSSLDAAVSALVAATPEAAPAAAPAAAEAEPEAAPEAASEAAPEAAPRPKPKPKPKPRTEAKPESKIIRKGKKRPPSEVVPIAPPAPTPEAGNTKLWVGIFVALVLVLVAVVALKLQ